MENGLVATVDKHTITDLMQITSTTSLVPRELQPFVKPALDEFKYDMATELGLPDYEFIDKGDLPSRQNGKVGGGMTKKMVAFAEAVLAYYYRERMLEVNYNGAEPSKLQS